MQNSFGEPQTILLLGGTSDIGLAIVHRLASPMLRSVVLACRNPEDASSSISELAKDGATAIAVAFDAKDSAGHAALIESVAADVGDLDVVILAFGVLGEQADYDADPAAAAAAVTVNYTGAVSVGLAVATQLRAQGHGHLVVLSSVAGERVRASNFVYGSSKAGLDGFAQGLGDSLEGSGASVLVVRPGFVKSSMTEGMKAAPFSTTPDEVADVVAAGLRSGRRTVWAPGILRYVFMTLRHLPGAVFRKLPLG
ncbi:MAG: short-chain dehydrogenase/reductase [Ilumatobacteraceae bacterium]|nr:short-chain dehydrogenase/reductase [Ilumatobacteraceae bacterium]